MLTPVAVVLFVLYVYPFVFIVLNSFRSRVDIVRNPMGWPETWQVSNYVEAFEAMHFVRAMTNSLTVTVSSLVLVIVFSSMFAYFLARWHWKFNTVVFTLLVMSMIIPFQVLMIPYSFVFGQLNLLDTIPTLVFSYVGFAMAQSTFLYHGFIKGIPKELEEAATIDGANRFQVFARVVFPMLKPITATIAIINGLWFWNDFLLPFLVLRTPGLRTIPLSTFVFFGRFTTEFGVAMAALIMAALPIVMFFLFAQKYIIRGLVEGAIK